MTAPEDLPPVQPMGPMPGTGSGERKGGPDFADLAALGLDGDPVARVLWLRAELERAVELLTAQDRADLVQYGWPPAVGHLRAVA